MTAADRLEAAAQALHAADTGSLLDWPDLSETAREDYRRTARAVANVYEPAVAEGAIWERRDERTAEALAEALGAPIVAGVGEDALVGYVQALATERDRAKARAEFTAASDALLRQVLADALESGASELHDAGAWQAFVERLLTTPTTPGVEALREVVACARRAVRLLTPAEMVCEAGGRDVSALRAALARLDACAAEGKEPT